MTPPSRLLLRLAPGCRTSSCPGAGDTGGIRGPHHAIGRFLSSLARKIGLGGSDTTSSTQAPAPAKPKVADAKSSAPKAAAAPKPAGYQTGGQPPAAETLGRRGAFG